MGQTSETGEKRSTKIVIHFSDGTTQTIKRGMIAEMKTNFPENEAKVVFHFAGASKKEVVSIIYATINLAYKYGIFKHNKSQ